MTVAQWRALLLMLTSQNPGEFHHGDCIGSDYQAANGARFLGFRIVAHPPTNSDKRAFFPSHETRSPLPYLARNKMIVESSQEMIATPYDFTEHLRSGTWSTVRYARQVGKPVHVILPDGQLL